MLKLPKDRLKVIVASEQGLGRRLSQDKIDQMKKEIMQVVSRYVSSVARTAYQMQVRSEAEHRNVRNEYQFT